METTRIKVIVTEKATKEGRKFKTFKTFSKNGRATELKFRKEVENLPTESCYITVNTDDVNLNTSGEYPVCWIRGQILKVEPLGTVSEEQAEKNRQAVQNYFG